MPSCPDWTIADLLSHIGRIHRYVTGIVTTRPNPPTEHWSQMTPPPVEQRLAWFREGYPLLADALGAADPDDDVWTWATEPKVRFWSRRMAHEIAVHRWDAQRAAGVAPDPIPTNFAADAIQEAFDILPARKLGDRLTGNGETIHLHCTDTAPEQEGEWLLRLTPDGLEVTREHAKGDVAARGAASDLLLLVWGRIEPDAVEVFGDASLLTRWQEIARF
jgi:uncharacterized protein (TIGR03083 family)